MVDQELSQSAPESVEPDIQQAPEPSEPSSGPAGQIPAEAPPEKELSIAEKMQALKTKSEPASPKPEAPVIPAEGAALGQPEAPKYEPNFKYKAFGKEKELDPFFRDLIKDPESEKRVKDIFTKVDAFDDIKGKYESRNTEYQEVSGKYQSLDKDVRRLTDFLNKGDYDNFFGALRISDENLLQHLQRKAEVARMSPVQQQSYQDAINLRANQYNREEEYNQMRETINQQAVQYRTMQLDSVLQSSEVASAAGLWDARMGQGAFRQLVIEEGANLYRSTNRDVSPAEVAQMVLHKYGRLLGEPQPQVAQAPSAQPMQAPQALAQVQAKPVIPGIQGRGASPIKQAPKSLDDLRKLAKERAALESSPE